MRCRRTNPRPVNADQMNIVMFRVNSLLGRSLPASNQSSIQPEDRAPLRSTELGEVHLKVVAGDDVSIKFGADYSADHAERFTCDKLPQKSLLCCMALHGPCGTPRKLTDDQFMTYDRCANPSIDAAVRCSLLDQNLQLPQPHR